MFATVAHLQWAKAQTNKKANGASDPFSPISPFDNIDWHLLFLDPGPATGS